MIIPGLGGFVSQFHPARIVKVSGTFIPPAKEIVFNSELLQNDGMLAGFLAVENGISPEEARLQVERFVDATFQQLKRNEHVIIDGIGQFILDNNDLRFVADEGANLLLESYGLATFQMREAARRESPVTADLVVAELSRPHRNRTLRRVAVAVPILIAFSLLPFNSRMTNILNPSSASFIPDPSLFRLNYPDPIRKDTAMTIVFPITDTMVAEIAATDTVNRENVRRENVKSEDVKSEDVKSEDVKSEGVKSVDVKNLTDRFSVIAGCFKIRENADRLHKQLTDKGYPAAIITSRTGLFKVIMESFASKQEAIEGLARLKKAEPGMQLWAAL